MDTVEMCGDIMQPWGKLRPLVLFIENLLYFKKRAHKIEAIFALQ